MIGGGGGGGGGGWRERLRGSRLSARSVSVRRSRIGGGGGGGGGLKPP